MRFFLVLIILAMLASFFVPSSAGADPPAYVPNMPAVDANGWTLAANAHGLYWHPSSGWYYSKDTGYLQPVGSPKKAAAKKEAPKAEPVVTTPVYTWYYDSYRGQRYLVPQACVGGNCP